MTDIEKANAYLTNVFHQNNINAHVYIEKNSLYVVLDTESEKIHHNKISKDEIRNLAKMFTKKQTNNE